ncbi:MAG: putative TPR repeat methyltransferase [Candidatus Azotimanducaceae bacterium]|jgi:predicted TPR repeat methyltransferase
MTKRKNGSPSVKHREIAQLNYLRGIEAIKQNNWQEAVEYFKSVLTIIPGQMDALHNLGALYQMQGRLNEAEKVYRSILNIAPKELKTNYNLANLLKIQGKPDEALVYFRKTLEIDSSHISAQHMQAALSGITTESPPDGYTVALFDQYAERFDETLVNELNYQVPITLRDTVAKCLGSNITFQNVLDLGCGTGLSGNAFRSISRHLTGVDISSKMLEQSSKKAIYDELHRDDIIKFLTISKERYDLVIAADVLVYVGNKTPLFSRLQNILHPGSYFAFSTEISETDNYVLLQSGRYAHSKNYIQTLSDKHGFKIKVCDIAPLRTEMGKIIKGTYYVLEKFTKSITWSLAILVIWSFDFCRSATQRLDIMTALGTI